MIYFQIKGAINSLRFKETVQDRRLELRRDAIRFRFAFSFLYRTSETMNETDERSKKIEVELNDEDSAHLANSNSRSRRIRAGSRKQFFVIEQRLNSRDSRRPGRARAIAFPRGGPSNRFLTVGGCIGRARIARDLPPRRINSRPPFKH